MSDLRPRIFINGAQPLPTEEVEAIDAEIEEFIFGIGKKKKKSSDFEEKDHPRAEDGKFIPAKGGSGKGGKKTDEEKALDEQNKKDFEGYAKRKKDFEDKAFDRNIKEANNYYDQADRRLQLVKKLEDKIAQGKFKSEDSLLSKAVKGVTGIGKIQKKETEESVNREIQKHLSKAEDLRRKGDEAAERPLPDFPEPEPEISDTLRRRAQRPGPKPKNDNEVVTTKGGEYRVPRLTPKPKKKKESIREKLNPL